MAYAVELRRHTDNDGDVLSPDGVDAAIGWSVDGGCQPADSTGARRVLGLTEQVVGRLGKGGKVLIESGEDFKVTPLT